MEIALFYFDFNIEMDVETSVTVHSGKSEPVKYE